MTEDAAVTGAVPADRLFIRLAQELSDLAETVGGLQSTLGPLLVAAAGADPALIPAIQQLDRVEQSLVNLGRVVARLRSPCDAEVVAAALATISLADLKRRLDVGGVAADTVDDEVEFF